MAETQPPVQPPPPPAPPPPVPPIVYFPANALPTTLPLTAWLIFDAAGSPVMQYAGCSLTVFYSQQPLALAALSAMQQQNGLVGGFVASTSTLASFAAGMLGFFAGFGCETFAIDWPASTFLFRIVPPAPFTADPLLGFVPSNGAAAWKIGSL